MSHRHKLLVHVGPSKTASTVLQAHLGKPGVDKGDFIYPDIGQVRPDGGQHNIAYELAQTTRYRQDVTGLAELEALLSGQPKHVIISSEDFNLSERVVAGLEDIALRHDRILEILFFVRDPLDRLNSMYTQQVKTLATTKSFADFLQTSSSENRLYPVSIWKRLAAEHPSVRMTFVPFVDSMSGVFAQVCKYYGVQGSTTDFHILNEAPAPEVIRFYLENSNSLKGKKYWGAIRKAASAAGFTRKYYGFTDQLFDIYNQKFAEEYAQLGELPFIPFCEAETRSLIDGLFQRREAKADTLDEDKYQEFSKQVKRGLQLA